MYYINAERIMAYRIALVTDSTCDIPHEWVRQYEIGIVPLTIVFGDRQFLDGVDLSASFLFAAFVSFV